MGDFEHAGVRVQGLITGEEEIMAIRKLGSRRIVVDGVVFRWRIRKRVTYGQQCFAAGLCVAVELSDCPASVLLLLPGAHPKNWMTKDAKPVKPADVTRWIREAILAGWDPEKRGPQFFLKVDGSVAREITVE